MHREDKFVLSHRPYAVDLSSLRHKYAEHDGFFIVDAVWFRRKNGITAACVGVLSNLQRPAPKDAAEFLERHDDGRYGAKCLARWDGTSFWCAGQDPEENARYLELLKPMLKDFPAIPPGRDGWWRF